MGCQTEKTKKMQKLGFSHENVKDAFGLRQSNWQQAGICYHHPLYSAGSAVAALCAFDTVEGVAGVRRCPAAPDARHSVCEKILQLWSNIAADIHTFPYP